MKCQIYKVTQMWIDDDDTAYEVDMAFVRARNPQEARNLLTDEDHDDARRIEWGNATVTQLGWATGPDMKIVEVLYIEDVNVLL